MRCAVVIALVLVASTSAADDRGGDFDILLEGGPLVSATDPVAGIAPVAHVVAMGRARVASHVAITAGLSALPVPDVFALGALGRIEWRPLSGDPNMLSIFAGTRLMILQPIWCAAQNGFVCSAPLVEASGIFGEIGIGLRAHRSSGYRIGVELSALAGSLAPYGDDHGLHDFYFGGIAGLAITF